MIMIKVFQVKGKYMMQYTCMYIYNNFSISYISQVIYLIYIIHDMILYIIYIRMKWDYEMQMKEKNNEINEREIKLISNDKLKW